MANWATLEINPKEIPLTTSLDVVLQGQGMGHGGDPLGQRTAAVLQQQEEQSVCRGRVVPSKSTKRVASTLPDVKLYEPWGTGIRSFLIFCSQILMMISNLSFFPVVCRNTAQFSTTSWFPRSLAFPLGSSFYSRVTSDTGCTSQTGTAAPRALSARLNLIGKLISHILTLYPSSCK